MGKAKILLLSAVAALLILGLVVYVARALPSNPGPVSWIEWLVIFICLGVFVFSPSFRLDFTLAA
jgi:hypothetical protein